VTKGRVLTVASIVLASVAWVSVIVASGAGWNLFAIDWNFTNPGAFGDSFGPLSASMAAVAAIAALLAWRSQVDETERARANEASAKEETVATRDEATLFQMISLLRQTVSAIDIHLQSGKIKKGHDAIAHILGRIAPGSGDATSTSYQIEYARYRNDLGHYFRLAYNIFDFINRSHLKDKRFYAKLVRALFSDAELALVALNCEYGEGKRKFKPLVEEFCLLNNLSEEMIMSFALRDSFAPGAFKHSE
jgi:hypothetical protein